MDLLLESLTNDKAVESGRHAGRRKGGRRSFSVLRLLRHDVLMKSVPPLTDWLKLSTPGTTR